jgi:hypothetical protein
MKSAITLVAAALSMALVSAPASAQHPSPHQVSVAGTYDLNVEHGGQAISSVLTIWKEKDGRLAGTITIHGEPVKLDTVTVKGHDMTIHAVLPHGALVLSLAFKSKDELAGTLTMEGMGNGTASGTRRKS